LVLRHGSQLLFPLEINTFSYANFSECNAPDCQLAFGPGCDGNKVPAGSSTSSIARTKVGSVPYGGAGIYDCGVAGGQLDFGSLPSMKTDVCLQTLP
jgi:hypothetical protein